MSTTTVHSSAPVTDIKLAIGGMTCESCANRGDGDGNIYLESDHG